MANIVREESGPWREQLLVESPPQARNEEGGGRDDDWGEHDAGLAKHVLGELAIEARLVDQPVELPPCQQSGSSGRVWACL
ncbi:hypothetical protein BH24CHL4_BH24CHL4_15150 [soil metagenome]